MLATDIQIKDKVKDVKQTNAEQYIGREQQLIIVEVWFLFIGNLIDNYITHYILILNIVKNIYIENDRN